MGTSTAPVPEPGAGAESHRRAGDTLDVPAVEAVALNHSKVKEAIKSQELVTQTA